MALQFCLCPPHPAALRWVLKLVSFDTSQSRSATCLVASKDGLQATDSLHRSSQWNDWIHHFHPVPLVQHLSVLQWCVPALLPWFGSNTKGLPDLCLRKFLRFPSASTCQAGTTSGSWDLTVRHHILEIRYQTKTMAALHYVLILSFSKPALSCHLSSLWGFVLGKKNTH